MVNRKTKEQDSSDVVFDPSMTATMSKRDARAFSKPQHEDQGPLQVEVIGGPMDGSRCSVNGECLSIGRSQPNDLHLALDPMVSGSHANIVREGKRYWLEDMQSRNGTYLGDVQLDGRASITPGSCFLVGCTLIEFMPH